jgi:hypothetical protein
VAAARRRRAVRRRRWQGKGSGGSAVAVLDAAAAARRRRAAAGSGVAGQRQRQLGYKFGKLYLRLMYQWICRAAFLGGDGWAAGVGMSVGTKG